MLSINQITSLEYSKDGTPTVRIATTAANDPRTLEFSADGSPWYGLRYPVAYTLSVDEAPLELEAYDIGLFYNQAKPISIVQPYIVVYMFKRIA
jgi:hypothetical protein